VGRFSTYADTSKVAKRHMAGFELERRHPDAFGNLCLNTTSN